MHKTNRMYKIMFVSVFLFFITIINIYAQREETKRPKIGLVLSGGGAKGFAHVGVLKVIEELGIPIDYITGTSMGAIIGGMYSMGYSASEIEKLISSQDWSIVLTDYVYRGHIPLYDRDEYDRYAFSFPIRDKGVSFPDGIVHGQNVLKLFCRYSLKYHSQKFFSELPIPFACVGSDIVNGEACIIEDGYLPLAMRASMSIPTIFTPVEYKGRMLVDGGIINNFPAIKAKEMGADIIIGVDVQKSEKTKDEIRTLPDIIDQAVFFMGMDVYKDNVSNVDVHIRPNIDKFAVSSFDQAKELIDAGEDAARKSISKLVDLKKELGENVVVKPQLLKSPHENDSLYVRKVVIKGVDKLNENQVLNRLYIKAPGLVTIKDIELGVDKLYASLNFKTVMYRLDRDILEITVDEKITDRFNVGIHYDSWEDASILLNTTFNNILRRGSKFSLDLKLAKRPRFMATYRVNNGWKPGIMTRVEYNKFSYYEYDLGDKKGESVIDKYRGEVNVNSVIADAYSVGIGARFDNYISRPKVFFGERKKTDNFYISYYTFLSMDTHERKYYPRTGISMHSEFRLLVDNSGEHKSESPYSMFYFDIKKPIRLSKDLTLIPQLYASGLLADSDNPPLVAMTMWGGTEQTKYVDNQIPFIGLRSLENNHKNGLVVRTDIRWEMWRKNYLILKANIGKYENFFSSSKTVIGAGLSFSYDSVIGPMEASVMYSNDNKKLNLFVNLGYWF